MRDTAVEILLITTRKKGRWSVSKGWPIKRSTPQQTAATEAYEEAGVRGAIGEGGIGRFKKLGLLAAAGWYAYAGLPAAGEQLRSDYYIALGLGAIAAVTVLMALLFYSSRPRLRRGSPLPYGSLTFRRKLWRVTRYANYPRSENRLSTSQYWIGSFRASCAEPSGHKAAARSECRCRR